MPAWLDFATCFDVDEPHIESALAPAATIADELPRAKIFALMDRMASIARPRQGAPRILFVIARLTSCDWVEGDVEVRVQAKGDETLIDIVLNDGMLRSRLRPTLVVGVPFEEFETALGRITEFIAPLQVFELAPGESATLGVDSELEVVGASEEERPKLLPTVELDALGVRTSRRRSIGPKKRPDSILGGAARHRRPRLSQYPHEDELSAAVVAPIKGKPSPPSAKAELRGPPEQVPKQSIPADVPQGPARPARRSAPRVPPSNEPVPPIPKPPRAPRTEIGAAVAAPGEEADSTPGRLAVGPGEGSLPPKIAARSVSRVDPRRSMRRPAAPAIGAKAPAAPAIGAKAPAAPAIGAKAPAAPAIGAKAPAPPSLERPAPPPFVPPRGPNKPPRPEFKPKSTTRMAAVRIPEEAFRPDDEQEASNPAASSAPELPDDEQPTVRPPSGGILAKGDRFDKGISEGAGAANEVPTVRPPPDGLPLEAWAETPEPKATVTPVESDAMQGPDTAKLDDSW